MMVRTGARIACALLLLVTGCSRHGDAEPETAPVNEGTPKAVGQPFTLAWKAIGGTGPEDRKLTITVTKFACGDQITAYLVRGTAKYQEAFGRQPDAKVDAGHTPCAAILKVTNKGKKKAYFSPMVTAVDAGGVEYYQDDGLTELVSFDVNRHHRERFGGNTVGLEPRETATTATAYEIPAGRKITRLRYVIEEAVDSAPVTALIEVG